MEFFALPSSQRYRIFFFRGKVWGVLTHSFWAIFVFFFFGYPEKKTRFFSQKIGPKVFFFFLLQEKFTRHSLTRFQRPEKKKQPRKKKTAFSLTHSKNHKNVQILNFSGEKKIRYLWVNHNFSQHNSDFPHIYQ